MAVNTPYATYGCSFDDALNCSAAYTDQSACERNPVCSWILQDDIVHKAPSHCERTSGVPSCRKLVSYAEMVFCVCMGLVGLTVAMVGHRYFQLELLFFGFMLDMGIAYISLSSIAPDLSYAGLLSASCGIGLVGAGLIYGLWFVPTPPSCWPRTAWK